MSSIQLTNTVKALLTTWSRLDKLLGSWLSPWYCPRRRSPAAMRRNFLKSTTYSALYQHNNKQCTHCQWSSVAFSFHFTWHNCQSM